MTRTVADNGPHPVDLHVGRRVAETRMQRGHTQTDLARAIGLTFQQVQKYEKGENRISASKLFDIAAFFGVQIGDLYDGLADPDAADQGAGRPASGSPQNRTTLEITSLARRLTTPQQRLALSLIQALAEPKDPAD